jgi:hypothetical protein
MKMSDKRKFVVAPKSREIAPHVLGVKICVTKKWPVTARLSQSVEHETLNLRVVGSSPTLGAKICVTKKWPVTAPGSQGVFGA